MQPDAARINAALQGCGASEALVEHGGPGLVVRASTKQARGVLESLKGCGFDFLVDLFGVDTGEQESYFGMNDAVPAIDPLGSGDLSGFGSPLPPADGQFLAGGGDAAEVARQLSNLSPAAARAVAAAAKATTDEEREAALAAVSQDGEEPIDRELLLRFLASVKS